MWNSVCVAGQSFKAQRIPSGLRIPTARYILMRWRPSHRPGRGCLPHSSLSLLSHVVAAVTYYWVLPPRQASSFHTQRGAGGLRYRHDDVSVCAPPHTHTGYRHVTCPKEGDTGRKGGGGCAGARGLLLSLCWVKYVHTYCDAAFYLAQLSEEGRSGVSSTGRTDFCYHLTQSSMPRFLPSALLPFFDRKARPRSGGGRRMEPR